MNKRFYCTLFDTFYLSRGLAMIDSLLKHDPAANMIVFSFDATCESVLRELAIERVQVVSLNEFETPELLAVKPNRKRGEYCWTSTPFVIAHCLKTMGLPHCTYVDADLFFFSSPEVAFTEAPVASVLLTEHRYTPRYDQSATSGRYCVQFMYFRNDEAGLHALNWWGQRCLEWCHDYYEDGKFGDQKYLDDWLTRFKGVHAIAHEGVGLAPWNIQQYKIGATPSGPTLTVGSVIKAVVCYHFHAFKFLPSSFIDLGMYILSKAARQEIYRPYVQSLAKWQKTLDTFNVATPVSAAPSFYRKLRRAGAGFPNILAMEKLSWRA